MRTVEPTTLTQGERIQWERTFEDYPATLYTLQYRYAGTGTHFNVTCTADGVKFLATLAVQANQAAGKYWYQAWLTEKADSSNTFLLEQASGIANVVRGLPTAGPDTLDLRSDAEKIVAAIDAALYVSAGDVIEYEVSTPSGITRVKRSRNEAIEQRKYYAGVVARERAAERVRTTGKFGQAINFRVSENK